ncbi:UNVERIFIED_CONTAM: hypothetical protein PYX00_002395 [Menopon gallinae]|uniref:MICOS complex subunit MIC19 n=1 Tax=Menopon gallinae TaxID=328185 RepID=A0AAW2IGB3_9NEOP
MGAAESTPRRITIPNENQFIKITDSLAERLLACQKKSEKSAAEEKAKEKARDAECPPTEADKNVRDYENSGDALINYYYGPSVTSLRVLQAKEKELKESENYWSKRIENLEQQHVELKQVMEDQYHKAVDEINNQVPRPPPDTPFPCMEHKNRVLSCYSKNSKQPLLCAEAVTEFADCVTNRRIDSLQGRKEMDV